MTQRIIRFPNEKIESRDRRYSMLAIPIGLNIINSSQFRRLDDSSPDDEPDGEGMSPGFWPGVSPKVMPTSTTTAIIITIISIITIII